MDRTFCGNCLEISVFRESENPKNLSLLGEICMDGEKFDPVQIEEQFSSKSNAKEQEYFEAILVSSNFTEHRFAIHPVRKWRFGKRFLPGMKFVFRVYLLEKGKVIGYADSTKFQMTFRQKLTNLNDDDLRMGSSSSFRSSPPVKQQTRESAEFLKANESYELKPAAAQKIQTTFLRPMSFEDFIRCTKWLEELKKSSVQVDQSDKFFIFRPLRSSSI